MLQQYHIVASGGWLGRAYRTQPVSLLVAAVTLVAGMVTGILAIAVVVLWRVDGVIPAAVLRWTMVGVPVTGLLSLLVAFVSRREKERTMFKYDVPNPDRNPRNLY